MRVSSEIQKEMDKGNVTHIEDNDLYLLMVEIIKEDMTDDIKIDEKPIITSVQHSKGWKLIEHNAMLLLLDNGSHIRIAPTFNGNVEITRVISNRKGDGTYLMNKILDAYNDIETPNTLILECTGSVGYIDMDIRQQCKFFRKFGFRKYGKYNKNHIKFKL